MSEFDLIFTSLPDEIPRISRPGIPDDYDLQRLLSNTMRNKDWVADFADAASKILHAEIEVQRKALALSRSPEFISRVFKILLAKQLGLDYKSDLVDDEDYDRIIDHISLHNLSKGPDYWIKFLGFIKNLKLELIRLWSDNYLDFWPGVPAGRRSIFDNGGFYPTTHVGLIYEEFFDGNYIDMEELENLFYKMAPINLVLKWIAAVVTTRIGTLYMGTRFISQEIVELRPTSYRALVLIISSQILDEEYILVRNYDCPTTTIPMPINTRTVDIDFRSAKTKIPGALWNAVRMPRQFNDWQIIRPSAQYITEKDGFRRIHQAPTAHSQLLIDYTDPNNPGILFEPTRTNYLKFSTRFDRNPIWSNFSVKFNPRATLAADNVGAYRVFDTNPITQGYFQQVVTDFERGPLCLQALTQRDSSRFVAMQVFVDDRPPVLLVADLITNTLFTDPAAPPLRFGIDVWSEDWRRPWLAIDATNAQRVTVRFYPSWGSLSLPGFPLLQGSAYVEYLQLEQGLHPTGPIPTLLATRSRTRNYIDLNGSTATLFNKPCGYLHMKTQILASGLNKVLFEARPRVTGIPSLSVKVVNDLTFVELQTASGLKRFPPIDSDTTPSLATYPGYRNFALRWNNTQGRITFFTPDFINPQELIFPSNFADARIGSSFVGEGTYMRLLDFRLFGFNSEVHLPSDADLLALVS